ncbi:MAG: gliding motility-associated-like protein [Arenicella sp.]|jgi:gliding motility-associated-like protein
MKRLIILFILLGLNSVCVTAQYTWSAQTSNTTDFVRDIHFAPTGNAIGIYGTYNGEIGRTNNGGQTWTFSYDIPEIGNEPVSDLIVGTYIDDDQNCVVATNGGQFYISSNGGTNWSMSLDLGPIYLQCLEESNGRVFSGGTSEIYFSEDLGVTWDSVDVAGAGSVVSMSFIGDDGVAVSASKVFITSDLGDTWTEVNSLPHLYSIRDVEMTTASTFFTAGDFGEVMGTDNDGVLWNSVVTGVGTDLYKIEFGNATHGVISGANGVLLMTDAGGFDPWDVSPNGGDTVVILALHVQNSQYAWFGNDAAEIFKAPDPLFGIEIIEFVGPDTICYNQEFDFSMKFKATVGDAAFPQFQILLAGYSLLGSYYVYPGVVPNGDTAEIFLSATPTTNNPPDSSNNVSIQGFNGVGGFIAWYFPPPPDSTIYLKTPDPYTVSGPHEFCPGEAVAMELTGGVSYTWTANVDNPLLSTNTVYPLLSTSYLVSIQQQYCTIDDTVFVIFGPLCDTSTVDTTTAIPAGEYAFSPNNDNVNDTFVIDYLDGTDNTVQIYNRWGDLIADFVNYNNEDMVWDGTYAGVKVGAGTYFFLIAYNGNEPTVGWVQVVE